MRHNLYDEREKEARKLQKLINASPWRRKVVYEKPVWDGDYMIKWVLNPKHETHPDANTARSLVHLIPKQIISRYSYNKWKKDGQKNLRSFYLNSPSSFYIREDEYFDLNQQQQKFFTNRSHYQWYWAKTSGDLYVDWKGRTIYRMKSWEFNYFYIPVITKHKIKQEWIRAEEPEYRIWKEKLYDSGFGYKYLFREHHSDRYRHIDPKGRSRVESRQLQYQIQQGIEDFYEEKEGTSCRGITS
jgi:hypothetical protein